MCKKGKKLLIQPLDIIQALHALGKVRPKDFLVISICKELTVLQTTSFHTFCDLYTARKHISRKAAIHCKENISVYNLQENSNTLQCF